MSAVKRHLLVIDISIYFFLIIAFVMHGNFRLIFSILSILSALVIVLHPEIRKHRVLWPWSLVQLIFVITLVLAMFPLKIGEYI